MEYQENTNDKMVTLPRSYHGFLSLFSISEVGHCYHKHPDNPEITEESTILNNYYVDDIQAISFGL